MSESMEFFHNLGPGNLEYIRAVIDKEKNDLVSNDAVLDELIDAAKVSGKTINHELDVKILKNTEDLLLKSLSSYSFPKKFIKDETARQKLFFAKLKESSLLKNIATNPGLDAKLEIAKETAGIFCSVYSIPSLKSIDFIKNDHRKYTIDMSGYTAYLAADTMYLNDGQLEKLSDIEVMTSAYHEMVHSYQHNGNFEKYGVDFKDDLLGLIKVDRKLYMADPTERHAYAMERLLLTDINGELELPDKEENSIFTKAGNELYYAHKGNITEHTLRPSVELAEKIYEAERGGWYEKVMEDIRTKSNQDAAVNAALRKTKETARS